MDLIVIGGFRGFGGQCGFRGGGDWVRIRAMEMPMMPPPMMITDQTSVVIVGQLQLSSS